jgi:MFS transporter, ACS family, tartrate transporter
MLLGTANKK